MTLQGRLALGFAALGGLVVAMTLGVGSTLSQVDNGAQRLVHGVSLNNAVSEWSGHTRMNLERARMLVRSGRLPALMDEQRPRMQTTSQRINALQKEIERFDDPALQTLMRDVSTQRSQYLAVRKTLLDGPEVADAAKRLDAEMLPAAEAYLAALQRLEDHVRAATVTQATTVADHLAAALHGLVGTALAVLAAGAAVGWQVQRYVGRTLGGDPVQVQRIAEAVSRGELNQPIDVRQGDHTSLLATMRRMRDSLAETVGTVREGADAVAHASLQIAAGTEDLAHRTSQQAAALDQANGTLNQLSADVARAAHSVSQADAAAQRTAQAALQGGQAMREVVSTMGSVHASTTRIADITAVIDNLAFQTNMLALNASVEAARAGSAGSGFAVVAQEVRGLAQRCATAAAEIKGLTGDSAQQSAQGNDLALQAGATIEDVVQSIGRVTQDVGHIRLQGQAQSEAAAHIRDVIEELNTMAQQNSALVEENAAATHHLRDQAARLAQAVAHFRTAA